MSLTYENISAQYRARVAAALLRDKTFANDTLSRENVAKEIEAGQHSELAASLFKQFADATDPTAARVNGKQYLYLNFIVQSYLKKNVMAEDFYKIKADLHDLSIWGARLERSEIRQYKDLDDLADALRPLQQQRDKKKAQEEERKLPPEQRARLMRETTVVYDGLEGKIVMPHTKESCQYWGSNTKWCIAAEKDNRFEDYNKDSPVLICLPRISPQVQKDNKDYSSFKFAFVKRDLWDETDKRINIPAYLRPLVTAAANKTASASTREWLAHYLSIAKPPEPALTRPRHPDYTSWSKEKRESYDSVTQHGYTLQYAAASLRRDPDIVLAAVTQDGWALLYADASLRRDPDIVLAAVTQNGSALQYAAASLKRDRDFMLAAAARNNWALKYADASLKRDRDIVLAAVTQHGYTLQYAAASLRRDPAFLRDILHTCPQAFFQMTEDYKKRTLALVGEDGLHRALIDAALRWNKTHPGRETDNPCTPYLRHIPQLRGNLPALTDPAAARRALKPACGRGGNRAAPRARGA